MNFHHGYFIIYFIIFVNSVYIVCIHFIMYSFLLLTSTYTNNYIFIVIMVWNIFHLQRNKIYLCIKFKLLQNWSILLSIQKFKKSLFYSIDRAPVFSMWPHYAFIISAILSWIFRKMEYSWRKFFRLSSDFIQNVSFRK